MSSMPEIRSVTIVQEALDPSEMVKSVLGKLLTQEVKDLRMYTTARRVLDLSEYDVHPSQFYADKFRRAEMLVSAIAHNALLLSGEVEIQHSSRENKPSRIYFSPHTQAHLDSLVCALDMIPSIEAPRQAFPNTLYMRVPSSAVTRDKVLQDDVIAEIGERARHPASKKSLNAVNPRVVFRDLPRFAMRHPHILPNDY